MDYEFQGLQRHQIQAARLQVALPGLARLSAPGPRWLPFSSRMTALTRLQLWEEDTDTRPEDHAVLAALPQICGACAALGWTQRNSWGVGLHACAGMMRSSLQASASRAHRVQVNEEGMASSRTGAMLAAVPCLSAAPAVLQPEAGMCECGLLSKLCEGRMHAPAADITCQEHVSSRQLHD